MKEQTMNDLKAAVYDKLAQIQQYENAVRQIRVEIDKLNSGIAEMIKQEEIKIKKSQVQVMDTEIVEEGR